MLEAIRHRVELHDLAPAQHKAVMDVALEKSAFRRKLADLDFVEPVPGARQVGQHRPAQLYRLKAGARLAVFDRPF